jgi:hypothetical protein
MLATFQKYPRQRTTSPAGSQWTSGGTSALLHPNNLRCCEIQPSLSLWNHLGFWPFSCIFHDWYFRQSNSN